MCYTSEGQEVLDQGADLIPSDNSLAGLQMVTFSLWPHMGFL